MSSIQQISDIIRFSVQHLKKTSKGNPASQRNLLNKWFLDSIKNYFMEQYAAPLISHSLGCKTSQEVKERVHSKLDCSIPKYMSILFNYLELLEKYNKVQQFKSNLLDMIKDPINLLQIETSMITPSQEKLARKQFVGLMILMFCELRKDPEINSFYDLWNFTYPNDIQSKKRNIKYSPKQKDAADIIQEQKIPAVNQIGKSGALMAPPTFTGEQQQQQFVASASETMMTTTSGIPINKIENYSVAVAAAADLTYLTDKFQHSSTVIESDSQSSHAYEQECDFAFDNYAMYQSVPKECTPMSVTPYAVFDQMNVQNNAIQQISPYQIIKREQNTPVYRDTQFVEPSYGAISVMQSSQAEYLPENENYKSEEIYTDAYYNLNQRVIYEEYAHERSNRYYQVFSSNQNRGQDNFAVDYHPNRSAIDDQHYQGEY